MLPEQSIQRALVLTEKGNTLRQTDNQYLFEVDIKANKVEIRRAIQKLFNVKVEKVHTLIMPGKQRRMGRGYARTQTWKKAIVHVKKGETIEMFEGAS